MMQKKKRTTKYSEWKKNFYELIQANKINESDTNELTGLIKQILKNNELDPPNEKETDDFIDSFLPVIIFTILECRSVDQLILNCFYNILASCINLLQYLMISNHESFIESARKILENPNCAFFNLTFDKTYKASSVYLKLRQRFTEKGSLSRIIMYLESDSNISLEKIQEIINIILTVNNYFDLDESGSFALSIANYIYKTTKNLEPREINETEINQIFITLSRFDTFSSQIRIKLSEIQVKILMKVAKSDLLTKQFSALEAIKSLCITGSDYISPILVKGGIIDYLLKIDLHVKLVDSFSTIFLLMNDRKCITKNQLQQFWKKTIEQTQSTFPTFLAGMKRISDSMFSTDPLCQVILETNEFPDSIINFLQIISVKCHSSNIKKEMYNSLYNLYKNTPDRSPESLNLLIKAIGKYVCDDDIDFCNEQQNICLSNIENDKDVKLSLHILNCTFRKATSENARFYFNSIIKKIDKDSFEYLSLLVKIMRKFDQPLSQEEFNYLKQITSEMVKEHPDKIASFYKALFDEETSKVPLLNHNMKLEILILFCDLPFTEKNFKFIQFIYDKFNKDNYNSYTGIEFIWSYLFKTNRFEVANTLINIYKQMRDSNNVSLFIQNCAQNFNSQGSLYALETFIHLLQDGIDLQPGPNLFLFEDDYVTIFLTGDLQYTIQVQKDICYEGFARKISQISNVDSLYIQFNENGNKITRSSFYLYNNMTIQILINQNIAPQPIQYTYPSQILVNQQYIDPLFNILTESDPELAPMSLRILNLLPTLQEQFLELNEETEWEEFLCIDMPYLLVYRINMIANLVVKDPSKYVPIFYQNGMTALLNIVFNVASSIFPDTNSLITLLKISEFLLEFKEASEYKKGILDDLQESIPTLLQWIKTIAVDESNSIILGYLIHLLNEFHIVAASFPEFNDLVKNVIFHKVFTIRSGICQLVNSIQDIKTKEELIIPLLCEAKNSRCQEYFSVLVSIADKTENPDNLWNEIVKALYDDFTLPKKGTILDVLLFKPPPLAYAHGLFKTMNSLVTRVKTISEMRKLFEFIENEIIFNPYKYYMPNYDVFSVFLYLLDQDPKFNDILMPIINACKEFRLNQSTDNFSLTATKKNRGIRNMGATCYINSSIQQLYNITRFREQILLADFDTKNWSFEFQYVFAKLYLFPSEYIDISNFLSKWKGYDNNVINVHQQQDSVEFLQLFIDRINKKIPNISSMFTGEIEHKTFYEGNEISTNNEQFIIFPLEVKNQESVTTSLNTFLDPDKFEYDIEGKGKVNATRVHKVKKAPEILIIQLKRFEYNLKTTEREKINSKFNFSQELDFSPVMLNGSPIMYDLCGVVQHTGTANGGHYFSDVRRDDGKWICINDTSVRKINGETLLTEAAGGNEEVNLYDAQVGYNRLQIIDKTCNAYLLFYKMKESSLKEQNLSQISSLDNFSESIDMDQNSIKEEEDGISMECPGINSKLIKRLLPEIKEVILRSVCNSPQFSQLVMKICHQDQDGEFLYNHFANCLRMASDQNSRLQLVEECSNLCKSNQQFADFVLKQHNDFMEFSLKNSNQTIRQDYNNLVSVAISCCSDEGANLFYSYYLGLITNEPIIFFSFWECIEPFFKLFEKSIPKTIELPSLIFGLTTFAINGPAEYDKKCRADQIYNKIDLSDVFDLIVKYTNDENNQAIAFTHLIDSPNFIQLAMSPYHSTKFYNLISHLMKNSKNQEYFVQYLNKCDQAIPIPAITSLFPIVLSLDKEQIIDKFFNLLLQRNVSAIVLFFSNLAPIINPQSELMIKYSSIWIKKFFISKDMTLRETIANMMHILLPQFQYPPVSKNETADLKQLDILFHSMIDSLPVLDKFLEKLPNQSKQMKNQDQYPTQEYFDTLNWITVSGGYIDKIDFNQFINRLKSYGYNENHLSQLHVYKFLYNTFGQKLFDHISVSKFINALGSTKYFDIINTLPFIMPSKCNDYISSSLFGVVLRDGFFSSPNSNVASTGVCDAIAAINKIKTPDNANLIYARLFENNIFSRNIDNRCMSYIQYCWKLFKENPQASEYLYSSELYLDLWKLIIHQSREERPIGKMLAYFNFAYAQQNKDKKSFLKLKTDKLLEKYEDYEDDISYKSLKIYELLNRIKRKEHPKHPGSGGLCHLLRSFIKLSSKPKTNVFKRLEAMPEPMMINASPVKPIAMLVCDICLSMEPSKKVDDVFLREFSTLDLIDEKSYKAIEYFFMSFKQYFAERDKDKLRDFTSAIKAKFINSAANIRILSDAFVRLLFERKHLFYNNDEFAKIRDKTQTLIVFEINSLIQPATPPDVVKQSSKFLNNGYLIVRKITQLLGDRMPNHRISDDKIQQFAALLNTYDLEKEIDDFMSYTSG